MDSKEASTISMGKSESQFVALAVVLLISFITIIIISNVTLEDKEKKFLKQKSDKLKNN